MLEGPDADVVPSRMSGSLPPGMALLVVRRGPNAGARFLLDHDVTTSGRHPDSDIFLDDVTVSRRHAEFHRDGRHVHRARRGQPQRHVRQPGAGRGGHAVSNGDEVQIGKFRLVFIAGPRPDEDAARS